MSEGIILVVEDNDVLREGLDDMLTLEGYTVVSSSNGLQALSCMEETIPDLILADIAMPGMDGYQLFTTVRKHSDWVTIPFIFLTARAEAADVLAGKNMGAEDYLIKPVGREQLVSAIRSRLMRSRQLEMAQLKQAYEASLTALAKAIELRDAYTGGHVERVTAYTLAIASRLEIPLHRLEGLRYGAILHDIGKIHVPKHILLKTNSLDENDLREIHKHPLTGAEMIQDIHYLAEAIPIIRSHHERWDGGGYPDGLSGQQIPLGARIVSVADAFDAMITDRPYRPASSLEQAYNEILSCSGIHYDPQVVTAFQEVWQDGEIQVIVDRY